MFSQDSSLQQPFSPASEQKRRIHINPIHALERQMANQKHTEVTLAEHKKQRRDPTASLSITAQNVQETPNAALNSTSTTSTC